MTQIRISMMIDIMVPGVYKSVMVLTSIAKERAVCREGAQI